MQRPNGSGGLLLVYSEDIMNQSKHGLRSFLYLAITGFIALVIILIINAMTGPDSSPEWVYTIEWVNIFLIPIIIVIAVIFAGLGYIKLIRSRFGLAIWICCCLISIVLFVIPLIMPDYQHLHWQLQYLLSACWAGAFLFAGLSLFTAASRSPSILASLFCLIGSLAFGLAALEIALLCSTQYADGMSNLSAQSKYMNTEKGVPEYTSWSSGQCGATPGKPGTATNAYHRLATFDNDLFDVKYSLDARGWRTLPDSSPNAPNDLMLFGCSFTFGMGLEDEQTWAWQLAKMLGPGWKLENYSASGYSVNHMLCLLEHHLVDKPTGKERLALFLAIDHQIRRNQFFPNTPHYELDDAGQAIARGKAGYQWAFLLPHTFNGSQLAREIGSLVTATAMKHPDKEVQLYLAMLKQSAQILHRDYKTQLIVLLWPDMDKLADSIKAMGIPVLLAKSLLPEWDQCEDPGSMYRINRYYEPHPNSKAADELAKGLAAYFEELISKDAVR